MAEVNLIKTPVLAIVGPTAIGKTALSLDVSHTFNCEVISVDSMQIYRYMDIGTAKIRPEEMDSIPHHLIDIVNPDEKYDAARFVKDATKAINEIGSRGRVPLLTGGTGLYLKALSEGLFADIPESSEVRNILNQQIDIDGTSKLHEQLREVDPLSAARIHSNDTNRIIRGMEIFIITGKPWSTHLAEQKTGMPKGIVQNILQLGLTSDRHILYDRINLRTSIMIEQGLEHEVQELLKMGYKSDLHSMNSIGYRHMLNYMNSVWSFSKMIEFLQRDTRRYAKRQYTWFNKIKGLEWFEVNNISGIKSRIDHWLSALK